MKLKSKLFASAVAFTMVLSVVAVPVSAQTTAELTAQINSLLAMIAQLQAQIAGGAGATAGTTFTKDLTVGSTGANVTALQTWLVSKGFLTMPAGVAMGYFGSVTKTALAKYQTSAGITPASGYFGPITRAKVNAVAVVPGTPGTPGSTVVPGTITTPGAEGTITVTGSNANVVSSAYAGDSKDKILGFKVQAAGSDVAVQRVKVDLGANTTEYNKLFSTLYLIDDSDNTLGSLALNTASIVKDSGEYYATLTGFSSVVSKGQTRQYYIATDLYPSIDTTLQTTYTVQLANNSIRAVDGAGIDQYGPTTGSTVAATVSVTGNLSDLATLTVSSDASTPAASAVVANQGSANNQLDQVPLLVFDLQAKKDSVLITDSTICIAKTGAGGTAVASSTVYLFEGSTPIGSASMNTGACAVFSNINYTVPKDTTKVLTLKADIRSANTTSATFTATASSTGFIAQSSSGSTLANTTYKSGSVTGNGISARSAGLVITLNSKPSISTSGVPQNSGTTNFSTSSLSAIFNLHMTAVGGAIMLGTVASGTPTFASSTTGFVVYVNGAANAGFEGYGTSTSWSFPTVCSTSGQPSNTCTLSENSSMDVPVTFFAQGRKTNGGAGGPVPTGLYSVQLQGVQYSSAAGVANSATFMAALTDWRTGDVSFP